MNYDIMQKSTCMVRLGIAIEVTTADKLKLILLGSYCLFRGPAVTTSGFIQRGCHHALKYMFRIPVSIPFLHSLSI